MKKQKSDHENDNGSKTKNAKVKKYNRDFVEASIYKIGVDIDLVRRAPPITPVLAEAEGGLESVLSAMRFSRHPTILAFLHVFDNGTDSDRIAIPWEAWAIKAKLDLHELLGAILIAMRQQSVNVIKVLSVTSHPDVVRATIRSAKGPKGFKDRETLHTALGFLPQQKGSTFIGKYFSGTQGADADDGELKPETPSPARPDEVNVDDLFPDLGETQLLLKDEN